MPGTLEVIRRLFPFDVKVIAAGVPRAALAAFRSLAKSLAV